MSRTQGLPKQSRSASTQRVTKRPDAKRRYQAGERRTSAEPLRAAWRPPREQPARRQRKGVRRLVATYGWRIYALPILLVLTTIVLIDTVGRDDQGASAAGSPTNETAAETPGPGTDAPAVTEQPGLVDVNVPSAELPEGGAFPASAAGTWHIVPGRGQKIGTGGKLYTYTIEVEDGIDPAVYGGDEVFGKLIDATLADPRGWAGDGKISLQRIDSGTPSMRISLSAPDTVHRPDKCGYSIKYESSCYRRSDARVLINLARWVRGAVAFGGDMITYRQYAINHEVGHAFNNTHVGCATEGGLAPVMMQQTFGVANNFVAELNRAAKNKDPVEADGKTCKPNAWPNPTARR